jgi:hypothetical protein
MMIRAGMVFAVFSPVGDTFSLLHGRLENRGRCAYAAMTLVLRLETRIAPQPELSRNANVAPHVLGDSGSTDAGPMWLHGDHDANAPVA